MLPSVALHIGAHKTATTHLQHSLLDARAQLRAADTVFYGPRTFRKGQSITRRFGVGHDVSQEKAQKHLTHLAKGTSRVVMSEENFIGTLFHPSGRIDLPLYPAASDRIAVLAKQIAPEGLDLFIGVRNPASYLISAYCQALVGGHKLVWDEFKERNHFMGIDWADLARRLEATPGVATCTVWRQEDYGAVFPKIVTRLTGKDISLEPDPKLVHQSLSAKAVQHTLARYAEGKGRQAALLARSRFPVGPNYPPFDGLSPMDHKVAADLYHDQIAQIDAMDGVTRLKA